MATTDNNHYNSIETTPLQYGEENCYGEAGLAQSKSRNGLYNTLGGLAAATVTILILIWSLPRGGEHSSIQDRPTPTTNSNEGPTTLYLQQEEETLLPSGVNFGSWLSLEDYFFAGSNALHVATPDNETVAQCLPPLQLSGVKWQSETDLLESLIQQSSGGGLLSALQIFHAFRQEYYDWDEDLKTLSSLGIHSVRVPLTWCLTDYNYTDMVDASTLSSSSATLLAERFTCQDPFFPKIRWPAVPKSFVADFLRACAKHNVKAVLDVHTYPGGTSVGTFSGVWPKFPRFWTHGDQPATDLGKPDIGRTLWKNMVSWIETLAINDPKAFAGLRGLSPMNEPAHLAGLFGGPDAPIPHNGSYLPPLTPHKSKQYLEKLNSTGTVQHSSMNKASSSTIQVPNGPHLRAMLWLSDAVETFRKSSLPNLGKEIHVNIHESVLSRTVVPPNDGNDPGGRHPGATKIIASWWNGITSSQERQSWAVLDMHHYHAWEPSCTGAVDGPPVGNYTCGDVTARDETLHRCTSWVTIFRQSVDDACGPGAKLVSAEFSASTHNLIRHACNDASTLRASFDSQLRAAQQANVELFYWSFKMPYGGAFRSAWSFKQLLYLLGVLPRPDETNFECSN